MAKRVCSECNTSYADSASNCPGCGYVPQKTRYLQFIFALIAISWGIANTNAPSIFGAQLLELLHYAAASILYFAVLALLATPIIELFGGLKK